MLKTNSVQQGKTINLKQFQIELKDFINVLFWCLSDEYESGPLFFHFLIFNLVYELVCVFLF